MKKKFHENLSKYFEFGTANQGLNEAWSGGQAGDNIGNMWYREFDDTAEYDNKLKLIQDTTIAANMTVNSGLNKNLKICNNDGSKCYKLYVDSGGDLNIQSGLGGTATSRLIMGESTVQLPTGADTSSTRKSLRDQPHTHTYTKYTKGATDDGTNADDTLTAGATYT